MTIVELEKQVVFRPKLKEKLRQWRASWVGLSGHQYWLETRRDFESQRLKKDTWKHTVKTMEKCIHTEKMR